MKTNPELHTFLSKDYARFNEYPPSLKDRILHNEIYYIWKFVYHMRYIEYYQCQLNRNIIHKILYYYHWFKFKKLQFRLHLAIYPGSLGEGVRIYHVGNYTHIGPNVKIGKNCTIVGGVVFGNKNEKADDSPVVVGDNCYFGIGVTVLGSVKIGNNVSIGAHAVVTRDIPDNAIVVGVPAKIIKFKYNE